MPSAQRSVGFVTEDLPSERGRILETISGLKSTECSAQAIGISGDTRMVRRWTLKNNLAVLQRAIVLYLYLRVLWSGLIDGSIRSDTRWYATLVLSVSVVGIGSAVAALVARHRAKSMTFAWILLAIGSTCIYAWVMATSVV